MSGQVVRLHLSVALALVLLSVACAPASTPTFRPFPTPTPTTVSASRMLTVERAMYVQYGLESYLYEAGYEPLDSQGYQALCNAFAQAKWDTDGIIELLASIDASERIWEAYKGLTVLLADSVDLLGAPDAVFWSEVPRLRRAFCETILQE